MIPPDRSGHPDPSPGPPAAGPAAVTASRLPAALAALVLPLLGGTLFVASGRDDAFISYWAARTLAHHGEIVNYDGDRVEQSSSLLHTVILALGDLVTPLDVPMLGYVVGIVGGVACAVVAARVASRLDGAAGLPASLTVATAGFVVYWSFGGLETTIAALALLAAVLAAARAIDRGGAGRTARAVALGGTAVLARPEVVFVLLAGLAGLGVVVAAHPDLAGDRRLRLVRVGVVAAGIAAVAAAVAGARQWYFGQPVPQPVESKVGGLAIGRGLDYLERWAWRPELIVLVAAAAAGLWLLRRVDSSLPWLLAATAGAQTAFVVTSGGDWMEAGRFLVPAIVLVAPLAGVAAARAGSGRRCVAVTGALVVAGLASTWWVADRWSTGTPVWASTAPAALAPEDTGDLPAVLAANRVNARDIAFLARLEPVVADLAARLDRPVRVASGQAGLVVHELFRRHGAELDFVDLGSLSTDVFGPCEGGLVRSPLGHAMRLRWWVRNAADCPVPLPDLFFGLGSPDQFGPAVAAVYVPVLQQPQWPFVVSGTGPAGLAVPYGQFALVRRELVS